VANRIRFAESRDAARIQAIYAPFCEASAISFEAVPPTVHEMAERIAKVSAQYPWLVCDVDGTVAGYVYACQHRERAAYRWAVDVSVYVDAKHHRRGIGRGLYTSLFSMLREQSYFKAYAGITLPNPASVGVHEALGFKPAAVYPNVGYKLGQWRDVGWWELTLQPAIADPPEPTPFRNIRDTPAIAAALADGQRLLAV
jgi:phosphinothricin acetyltransferase